MIGPTVANPAQSVSQSTESSRSSNLARTFDILRKKGTIGLAPFVPAGYPDLQTTQAVLMAMSRAGASVIELGIPFSDPIADGPIVQEAFTAALAKKIRVDDVLKAVSEVRSEFATPIVAMMSYSILYRYGLGKFLTAVKQAGFSGLILPDLPPPEAQRVCNEIWQAGLDTILLVAPSTTPARRREIMGLSTGFVYYLSVSGITGERQQLPADLPENLAELRKLSTRPICVGFGISKPGHVKELLGLADGAIVGSGVVRQIRENLGAGPAAIARIVQGYCHGLLSEVPKI